MRHEPARPASGPDATAPAARRRRALRWLLIAALASAVLTLAVGAVVGARSLEAIDLPALVERLDAWRSSSLAMLAMLGCFVAGGLIVFPVNLLIAASVVVFGPAAGVLLALTGSVASAALLHEIGRSFPEHVLARVAGPRIERVRERIARHGVLAVAVVRLLPVAPYSIVSVAAGAAGIPRAPYLLGTALGMAPGILLYALFADRARAVLADPRPLGWAMLLFAGILILAAALLARALHRRIRGRRAEGNAA